MLEKGKILELQTGDLATVINVKKETEDVVSYTFDLGGKQHKKTVGIGRYEDLRRIKQGNIERFVRVRLDNIMDKLFDIKCKCDQHGCRCKLLRKENKFKKKEIVNKKDVLELFDYAVLYDCRKNNIEKIRKIVEAVYEFTDNNFYLLYKTLDSLALDFNKDKIHRILVSEL